MNALDVLRGHKNMTQKIDWTQLLKDAPDADEMIVENTVWDIITNSGQGTLLERAAIMWFMSNNHVVADTFEISDMFDDPRTNFLRGMVEACPDDELCKLGQWLERGGKPTVTWDKVVKIADSMNLNYYEAQYLETRMRMAFEDAGYEVIAAQEGQGQ
jgi:hypothetical protein